jgi:hypothetical protein
MHDHIAGCRANDRHSERETFFRSIPRVDDESILHSAIARITPPFLSS